MKTFNDVLRDAIWNTGRPFKEIAHESEISRETIYHLSATNWKSRMQKHSAEKITRYLMEELDFKIRRRMDEIERLENSRNELFDAYMREYRKGDEQ